MSDMTLIRTSLQAGTWHGVLRGAQRMPQLSVRHLNRELPGLSLLETREEGTWLVEIPVPSSLISDGVHTVVICDETTGRTLNSFSVIAGEALDDDLRAEVDMLRAELDMLKKAFRRHCAENA
jgi:hypothetical protein